MLKKHRVTSCGNDSSLKHDLHDQHDLAFLEVAHLETPNVIAAATVIWQVARLYFPSALSQDHLNCWPIAGSSG